MQLQHLKKISQSAWESYYNGKYEDAYNLFESLRQNLYGSQNLDLVLLDSETIRGLSDTLEKLSDIAWEYYCNGNYEQACDQLRFLMGALSKIPHHNSRLTALYTTSVERMSKVDIALDKRETALLLSGVPSKQTGFEMSLAASCTFFPQSPQKATNDIGANIQTECYFEPQDDTILAQLFNWAFPLCNYPSRNDFTTVPSFLLMNIMSWRYGNTMNNSSSSFDDCASNRSGARSFS